MTLGQSYYRLQETTAHTSAKREVDRFLRQALKDALGEAGYFEGTSREISWVAPLDRVGSAGGLQHLRLQARGDQLILSLRPLIVRLNQTRRRHGEAWSRLSP